MSDFLTDFLTDSKEYLCSQCGETFWAVVPQRIDGLIYCWFCEAEYWGRQW